MDFCEKSCLEPPFWGGLSKDPCSLCRPQANSLVDLVRRAYGSDHVDMRRRNVPSSANPAASRAFHKAEV